MMRIFFWELHIFRRILERGSLCLSQFIFPFVMFVLITYLVFHVFQGERGWFSLVDMEKEREHKLIELEYLRQENIRLYGDIKRLSTPSSDLDFLDERIRKVMGFTHPDEQVIFLSKDGS